MTKMPISVVSFLTVTCLFLTSCASTTKSAQSRSYSEENYAARLSPHINTREKVVLVNPNVHAWGAYDRNGNLIRAGAATSGGIPCPPDSDEADCRTGRGVFRITSLGDGECFSRTYPRPTGGGLMPYCMFFNNGQALHGSPDSIVIEDNVSHGCVRMRIPDAEWMRYNFASVGTKVIVVPYSN
jgi:hypothetical protein